MPKQKIMIAIALGTVTLSVIGCGAVEQAKEPTSMRPMLLAEVEKWEKGEIVHLGATVNSKYRETGVAITTDGKTLYFVSDRPGGVGKRDIWTTSVEYGQWTRPVNLGPTVNSPVNDGGVSVSADGKRLYFGSEREGGFGGEDIYMTTFVKGRWTPAVNLGPEVNTPANDGMVYISKDGRELYCNSDRPGGQGGMDIWVNEFKDGKWQKAVNLGPEVNSSEDEWGPYVSPDGQTLLFARGVSRFLAGASERIQASQVVRRATIENREWSKPLSFGPRINTKGYQNCQEVTADGKSMFFVSNRPGGLGADDIWMVRIE